MIKTKNKENVKVICIDGVKLGMQATNCLLNENVPVEPSELIYEGEYYNVVAKNKFPEGEFYLLAEKPNWVWYHSKRFAPLSEIDETEKEVVEQSIKILNV